MQKAGIPGSSGCLEYTSMIWHQIQLAKIEKSDPHGVFLNLENAFGSVPHSIQTEVTAVQKIERTIGAYVRKWSGVPKYLSTSAYTDLA